MCCSNIGTHWLIRPTGGLSFYTSLGHPDDFTRPEFRTLLKNALGFLTRK
jgi:hypothetical protein